MKSIKEKAKEYSLVREYVDSCGNLIRENSRVKQEQFTLGANYVIEEIEKLVKTTDGDGEAYHYNLYVGLVNLLEQLKK